MRVSQTHTLDGVEVVPGLRVWDYDLRRRVVGEVSSREADGDPWYVMRAVDAPDLRGSDMNPSRMWVRHPSTGEVA